MVLSKIFHGHDIPYFLSKKIDFDSDTYTWMTDRLILYPRIISILNSITINKTERRITCSIIAIPSYTFLFAHQALAIKYDTVAACRYGSGYHIILDISYMSDDEWVFISENDIDAIYSTELLLRSATLGLAETHTWIKRKASRSFKLYIKPFYHLMMILIT